MSQTTLEISSFIDNKKVDITEYFNALATNIQFLGKDTKKIVISSVKENEGKSMVSINLSRALANLGLKVLLIDADTRNSVLLQRLNIKQKITGLTSYLSGQAEIKEVIFQTDVSNFHIIPAGFVPPNSLTLLQGRRFEMMMKGLNDYYDYIIVDAPPVGLVIDAAVIAKVCDGSILVVESGTIKRDFVRKAKEQLEQSGTKFLGVILNKVPNKSYGKYGRYGGYGQYGNYGNYGKKVKK